MFAVQPLKGAGILLKPKKEKKKTVCLEKNKSYKVFPAVHFDLSSSWTRSHFNFPTLQGAHPVQGSVQLFWLSSLGGNWKYEKIQQFVQTEIIMGMGSLEFSGLGWVGIYLHSPAHRFHWEWEPKKENKTNREEEIYEWMWILIESEIGNGVKADILFLFTLFARKSIKQSIFQQPFSLFFPIFLFLLFVFFFFLLLYKISFTSCNPIDWWNIKWAPLRESSLLLVVDSSAPL